MLGFLQQTNDKNKRNSVACYMPGFFSVDRAARLKTQDFILEGLKACQGWENVHNHYLIAIETLEAQGSIDLLRRTRADYAYITTGWKTDIRSKAFHFAQCDIDKLPNVPEREYLQFVFNAKQFCDNQQENPEIKPTINALMNPLWDLVDTITADTFDQETADKHISNIIDNLCAALKIDNDQLRTQLSTPQTSASSSPRLC